MCYCVEKYYGTFASAGKLLSLTNDRISQYNIIDILFSEVKTIMHCNTYIH